MQFKSTRNFLLFDYNMSHSQLVLRSFKDKENDFNLDIIFFGVSQIQTIVDFASVIISWENKNHEEDIEFLIQSDQAAEMKITGAYFNVIKNSFDYTETSVFRNTDIECEIVFSSLSNPAGPTVY
ncbi:MAG: hypothetical protein AAF960_13210 [Bacteroidota bacterium]